MAYTFRQIVHQQQKVWLDALSEKEQVKLESLDSKFFEYPDSLTDLLFAYVGKHPEAFGKVPK